MHKWIAVCALVAAARLSAAIPPAEREALVALYQSTNGAAWKDRTNWLGATGTECTWFGVACDENQGHVLDLFLYDNNLDGTLPSDLRKLTALRNLQLWDNNLRGSLPPELSELSQLEILYAHRQHLSGRIPAAWGALKQLKALGLDGNQIEGPLPPELGAMTALEELTLSFNALTGTIPKELGNLTNLAHLSLSVNRLTDTIPKELGSLPKLEIFDAVENLLSGPIPPALGSLPAIKTLRLSYNQLSGGIPASLGELTTLEELDLSSNALGGTIPATFGDLASIRTLLLYTNGLHGPIPDRIWDLRTLETLGLGDNDLTGKLPAAVANLTNLQVLALYSNELDGTIPVQVATLSSLRSFELGGNAFTGPIPPELANLTNLTWLDLSANQLTGIIPRQLGSLAKLEVLHLYENQLEGGIPPELGQLGNLQILALSGNRLGGAIPEGLRNLANLQQLHLGGNGLTGPIPPWIGELTNLTDLFLGFNRLGGPIPIGLSSLEKLTYLDLGENELTGSFPDLSRMPDLRYLTVQFNQLSGPLPPSFGTLANLVDIRIDNNNLSGPLPKEIAGLQKAEWFDLNNNSFEGAIPPELGTLTNLYILSMWGNRFTGTIPKELGNLTNLGFLDLSFNGLHGPIPTDVTKLTNLEQRSSDFSFNALFTSDASVRAFLNDKQYDGDFEATQTVTPTNVKISQLTDRSATLTWTPIRYHYDGGGYQVLASTSRSGPPVAIATTNSKELDTITVRNLAPSTQYFFTVAAVTHPHAYQENLLVSDPSAIQTGMTGQRVFAPADVVITEQPQGMIQIDGVAVESDRFTVTNFGDVASQLTLERDGDFFTVEPESFLLNPGASRVVTLRSLPRAAGTFYGNVIVSGEGAVEQVAYLVLLSTARPVGTVVAEPLSTTIELAGAPGSDSVGTAFFRNVGTAPLTGIVLSDQPWIEPSREPVTIDPGTVGAVNFRVVRSRRPAAEGALVANLRLVYVSGGAASFSPPGNIRSTDTPPPGVSVSIVTVVDVTRPTVTTGTIPGVAFGEMPLFIPGMRSAPAVHSDLALLNAAGFGAINDLRLYFTQGAQTSIAEMQPLAAAQSLNLVNLVDSVYGSADAVGTLQVRTASWQNVGADAKVTVVEPEGTYTGALPVFRADRSIAPGESIALAGVSASGDLLIQETAGSSASVRITFLGANGNTISTRDEALTAFALLELNAVIPGGTATAVVASLSGSVTAYARLRDANGDTWSVVDWSRFYRYERNEPVRVPFADGAAGGGTNRRRAVRHDAPVGQATSPRFATALALFNPGVEEARGRVDVVAASGQTSTRDVTIEPLATMTINDAASASGSPEAYIIITPTRGELVATARSRNAAGGSAVPVLAATAGLRLGQTQIFTALDDSSSFRTGYGFVETAGAAAKVRARILIDDSNALVTAVTDRTYTLAPRQQIYLPELLRSFAGDLRDELGDFHALVLEIEVTEGTGAVVPFVIATDAGTGDTSLRLQ